jgi:hypothetical protein
MPLTTRIMMAVASLLVLLTIIQLVRRKRLDEKYAFLWVAAGLVMLFAPLATRPLDALSLALGVHNPGFISDARLLCDLPDQSAILGCPVAPEQA